MVELLLLFKATCPLECFWGEIPIMESKSSCSFYEVSLKTWLSKQRSNISTMTDRFWCWTALHYLGFYQVQSSVTPLCTRAFWFSLLHNDTVGTGTSGHVFHIDPSRHWVVKQICCFLAIVFSYVQVIFQKQSLLSYILEFWFRFTELSDSLTPSKSNACWSSRRKFVVYMQLRS